MSFRGKMSEFAVNTKSGRFPVSPPMLTGGGSNYEGLLAKMKDALPNVIMPPFAEERIMQALEDMRALTHPDFNVIDLLKAGIARIEALKHALQNSESTLEERQGELVGARIANVGLRRRTIEVLQQIRRLEIGAEELVLRCAFCNEPSEGNFALHRDGFDEGPEVWLCDAHGSGESPTCEEIWEKIGVKKKDRD